MNEHPYILVGIPSGPVENNCARPDGGLTSSSPSTGTADSWQIAPGLYRDMLPDGHELVFNPTSGSNILVLNTAARAILGTFSTPRHLSSFPAVPSLAPAIVATVVDRLIAHRLIAPAGVGGGPLRSQPRTLTAWLHVTNACNLRCTYCYIAKSDEAMDEQTGRAAVDAVFRSASANGFRAVKLKYAGGEATLNFDLIRALHEHATARAHETGIGLHAVVLSNGVALSRRMLQFLRDTDIRLMISLDGVGAAHDRQRTFANGRGSFSHVARAIDRAIEYGVVPDLSITVTGHNADDLPAALTFALDRDLRFNLNFYRENDCSAHLTDLAAEHARIIAGVRAAFAVIAERLPRRRLIDGLVDRSSFDQPHEYACGAGHSYLVIDQRGSVARCQMEIEHPVTNISHPDPLHVIRLEPASFHNLPVDQKTVCQTCSWRYWCAGGCPALTMRTTGRNDVNSPYCNVYLALYPEAVRLEGLRLLKWGASDSSGEVVERWA